VCVLTRACVSGRGKRGGSKFLIAYVICPPCARSYNIRQDRARSSSPTPPARRPLEFDLRAFCWFVNYSQVCVVHCLRMLENVVFNHAQCVRLHAFTLAIINKIHTRQWILPENSSICYPPPCRTLKICFCAELLLIHCRSDFHSLKLFWMKLRPSTTKRNFHHIFAVIFSIIIILLYTLAIVVLFC